MADDGRKFKIVAELKNIDVMWAKDVVTKFTAKDGREVETHKIEIGCDQEWAPCEWERIFLYDKNMSNLGKYKRGMRGTFIVQIIMEENFRTSCKMQVLDFIEDK